jgi:hypothetical protein
VWTAGALASLPPLGNDSAAAANAISDSGLVIGHSPRLNVYPESPLTVWWQNTGATYVAGNWNAFPAANSSLHLIDALAISGDSRFVVFDTVDHVTVNNQAVVAEVSYNGPLLQDFLDGG